MWILIPSIINDPSSERERVHRIWKVAMATRLEGCDDARKKIGKFKW
jgi:hypothetical protein